MGGVVLERRAAEGGSVVRGWEREVVSGLVRVETTMLNALATISSIADSELGMFGTASIDVQCEDVRGVNKGTRRLAGQGRGLA